MEVYTNGGKTFDRYTVILGGDVYTMSHNPLSPQGFNQYAGRLNELTGARQGRRLKHIPDCLTEAIKQRITFHPEPLFQ